MAGQGIENIAQSQLSLDVGGAYCLPAFFSSSTHRKVRPNSARSCFLSVVCAFTQQECVYMVRSVQGLLSISHSELTMFPSS